MKPSPDWGHVAFSDAMWAANFEPDCLGKAMYELFSRASTMREDTQEATDFVTSAGSIKWGSRIRRIESTKNKRDVTFRTERKSGAKTEIDKLKHVHLYVYAWADTALESYVVFAVKPLLDSGLIESAEKRWNHDGGSQFCLINWTRLQDTPGCLLAGRTRIGQPISYRLSTSKEYAEFCRLRDLKLSEGT